MTLYQNKYRIETTRLQNWDYSSDGIYFITILTKDRENIFGKIEHGTMQLNVHGRILEKCWFELPAHYSNLILDEFVIMPNHFHGIMIITVIDIIAVETGFKPVSTNPITPPSSTNPITTPSSTNPITTPVPTQPLPDMETVTQNHNKSTTKHGLFEFVRALKTFSSRRMNELDNTPGKSRWQQRFYDHIVRDEQELCRIREYIIDNPAKWGEDSLKQ